MSEQGPHRWPFLFIRQGEGIVKKRAGRRSVSALALLAVVLIAVLSACVSRAESSPEDKIILDCDMGAMNDDTMALSMLLQGEKQGNYKVIGITLEGGNVFIDAAFETDGVLQTCGWDNTKQFLADVGRTDIPVYRGTDYPLGFDGDSVSELAAYYENAEYLQYCDGYGAIHAFTDTVSGALCDSDAAVDFLIKSVKEEPGNVVIIATAPTMNIAKAVERDASFAENVRAIYYMGGALGDCYEAETAAGKRVSAVGGANVTPYAEYNALYDPSALFTCLTAGFPRQVITPAELSAAFESGVFEKLKAGKNPVALRWYEHYEKGFPEYPYWDPLTVFSYLRPEHIVRAEERYLTVNTDRNSDRFGETVAISAEEYGALSESDRSAYGRVTVIREVEGFWDETVALLCAG